MTGLTGSCIIRAISGKPELLDFFLGACYLGRNVRNRIGMLYQKLFYTANLVLVWCG